MTAKIIEIRDFKRREEREAADVRLAKQVMGLADDVGVTDAIRAAGRHNAAILERMRGVPANFGPVDPTEVGYPINVYDTAPSEMPPVQPMYVAEDDPA